MIKKNPLALVLGLSAFFFVIFLGVAVGTVMMLTPGKPHKKFFAKSNNIGVVEIKGMISDSKKAVEQIESFEEDTLIKAVVVRINSPGGGVAPSQEIYEALKKLAKKKPVYSSMSSLAASGGYYVACGTKKIYANPGTITGSIGVIMQFADLSKLMQWAKVNQYSVKTGKFKDIGAPSREMSQEEKDLLQAMIDNVLLQFRKAVVAGRNLPMEKVVEVSDGRIFSGEQAKEAKLVDELGTFNDAVEALAKEAGITGKPNLVYAEKKRRGLERFLTGIDGDDDAEGSSMIGSIAEIARGLAEISRTLNGGAAGSQRASYSGPLFILPSFLGGGN